ncbi:MAG TPA: hypothetical protein VF275_10125 [Gammaproteobacteria bacterium]
MSYINLLEILASELEAFKEGRRSLGRLVAEIEAIVSNHPDEVGVKELDRLVGELEIVNAVTLDTMRDRGSGLTFKHRGSKENPALAGLLLFEVNVVIERRRAAVAAL